MENKINQIVNTFLDFLEIVFDCLLLSVDGPVVAPRNALCGMVKACLQNLILARRPTLNRQRYGRAN